MKKLQKAQLTLSLARTLGALLKAQLRVDRLQKINKSLCSELVNNNRTNNKKPEFSIENLRQIYCMPFYIFCSVFGWNENNDYAKSKFYKAQKNLAGFLCDLDNNNIQILHNYLNNY